MKRVLLFLIALLILIPLSVMAQDQITINTTVMDINEKGIAFRNPKSAFTFLDDFFIYDSAFGSNQGSWVSTTIYSSVISVLDTVGGAIKFTADTTTKAGVSLQHRSEIFKFGQGDEFLFNTRILITDNDSSFFFIGFSVTDDSLLDGATDMFGFLKEAGDSLIYAVNTKNSVGDTTSTGYTIKNGVAVDLSVAFSDSTVFTFEADQGTTSFNRVRHTTAARMPTDEELAPVIELRNVNATIGSKVHVMVIDWFFFIRER